MITVGLTGSSGSGKGYVSEIMLNSKIPCLDTDKVCREVYLKGHPCYNDLVTEFGEGILREDGEIDRSRLFKLTFGDEHKYERLNSIAFAHIMKVTEDWISERQAEDHRVIVIDAPMLYESGFDQLCDKVICVISDIPTQVSRIMYRDGLSYDDARLRLSKQKANVYYTSRADYVLDNSVSNEKNIYRDTTRLMGVLRREATRRRKLQNCELTKKAPKPTLDEKMGQIKFDTDINDK